VSSYLCHSPLAGPLISSLFPLLSLYSNYFLANAVLELILTTTCALVYGVLTYFLCFYASSGDFAFSWGKDHIVYEEAVKRHTCISEIEPKIYAFLLQGNSPFTSSSSSRALTLEVCRQSCAQSSPRLWKLPVRSTWASRACSASAASLLGCFSRLPGLFRYALPPSFRHFSNAPPISTQSNFMRTYPFSCLVLYLFQWVSPLKYSYTAMVGSFFRGTPANTYVEMMDVTQPSGALVNLGCLLVFFLAYNVISFWGLHNLYRTKR